MNLTFEQITPNDDLMRSLPEISRATGIPMPVILRLKREFPEDIPSVGAGSQQFFPAGVVPILEEIHFGEGRQEARRDTDGPAEPPARGQQADTGEPSTPKASSAEAPPTAPAPAPRPLAGLARRFETLEERQRSLALELRRVRSELRGPCSGSAEPLRRLGP